MKKQLASLLIILISNAAVSQQAVPINELPRQGASAPTLLPGCLLPQPKLLAERAPLELTMSVSVSPTGSVESVEVAQTSGDTALDAAFAQAAGSCSFRAATRSGVPIAQAYALKFQWASKQEPQGLSRCFMPDYPLAARRLGVAGDVEVAFNIPDGDGDADVRVTKAATSEPLNLATTSAAKACLRQSGVRNTLARNVWYRQTVSWRLE